MASLLVVGINGSPHRAGLGMRLLSRALGQCRREGAEIAVIHLVDEIKSFPDGEYSQKTPVGLEKVFDCLLRADGVIFSTPVHWFNMSSLTKTLIDHMTNLEMRGFALEGRVAGMIATCEEDGGQAALSAMAAPLVHMGFLLPPYSMFFYNSNLAERSENQWQEKDVELLGANVVRLVRAIRTLKWGYESLS